MDTFKKLIAWVVALFAAIAGWLTSSAFVKNPKLIIEQMKQAKASRLAQIDRSLVATKQQIDQWKHSLAALNKKKDNLNAAIADCSKSNQLEKAGKLAVMYERYTSDAAVMQENISKCETTYDKLLKMRDDVIAAYDNKIAEAESSIVKLSMNRQMIELYKLTGQSLATDDVTATGITNDLVAALQEEANKLESELQVRTDVNQTTVDVEAAAVDSESAALSRWQAAHASAAPAPTQAPSA